MQLIIFMDTPYKVRICSTDFCNRTIQDFSFPNLVEHQSYGSNLYHIGIVKSLMYAERTTNWNLHLVTVKRMLNLFAAAGKLRKSGRLYLQSMNTFPEQNPWLQQCFQEIGHHAVIIERYWTGIWSDLVIEQVLMTSVRSRGGLSRGREWMKISLPCGLFNASSCWHPLY